MKMQWIRQLTSGLFFLFMNFKIMVVLIRLHLKMWVQVAVLTELPKKTNSITRELVFLVCVLLA